MTNVCTLFLAERKHLSYNCSRSCVSLEGDCDGSLYPQAIRSGSQHLFGGGTRWPACVNSQRVSPAFVPLWTVSLHPSLLRTRPRSLLRLAPHDRPTCGRCDTPGGRSVHCLL